MSKQNETYPRATLIQIQRGDYTRRMWGITFTSHQNKINYVKEAKAGLIRLGIIQDFKITQDKTSSIHIKQSDGAYDALQAIYHKIIRGSEALISHSIPTPMEENDLLNLLQDLSFIIDLVETKQITETSPDLLTLNVLSLTMAEKNAIIEKDLPHMGCSNCHQFVENMMKCPCGDAFYCGAVCQKEAWKDHKNDCTCRIIKNEKKQKPVKKVNTEKEQTRNANKIQAEKKAEKQAYEKQVQEAEKFKAKKSRK